jgi:serine protease
MAVICLAAGGCGTNPGGGGGGNGGTGGASLAGSLRIVTGAGVHTVVEREPNDWSDASQFAGPVAEGRTFHILGSITAPPPHNDVDTYRFTTTEPLTVAWRVTSADPDAGSAFDIDLGVVDFLNFTCDLNGVGTEVFAECHNEVLSGQGGSFIADGTFELVVVPARGTGSYRLEVSFGPPGDAPAARADTGPTPALVRRSYDPPRGEIVAGQTLARFDPRLTEAQVDAMIRARGMRVIEQSPAGVYRLGWAADNRHAKARAHKAAADLAALPGVRWAEPNRLFRASTVPDDQLYPQQRYPEVIHLPAAWDMTTGDRDILVAVIDTGVLYQHPDLGGRLLGGYDFVSDPARALDGDGRDADPWDPGDAAGAPHGSTFHGTHTTGTLAAMTDNRVGVAGVTWSCRVLPIRALGLASEGDAFDIAEAIRYAAGLENAAGVLPPRRADVLNLSFDGGAGIPPAAVVQEAVRDAAAAGVILVAAAGNQGSDEPAYPAGFDEVISVGAVDWNLALADYSNYGPTVDLVAPGGTDAPGDDSEPGGILSTLGSDIRGEISFEYGYRFGTSMACPQVSGVAALMLSVNPALSAGQVRQILLDTAADLGDPGRDDSFGYGLLNAEAAVDRARTTVGEGERPPQAAISTTVLDFGTDVTTLSVDVTNTGGGLLIVENATARELVGEGWLSVEAGAVGGTGATVGQIVVTVNRDNLAPGAYSGAVDVAVVGAETITIDVNMEIGNPQGPPDTIYVAAVPLNTTKAVASAPADAAAGYSFVLQGIGDAVWLVAGTDRDGDGLICESDDACGAWPSVTAPQDVLGADLSSGSIEITVDEPDPGIPWPIGPIAIHTHP